MFLVILGLKASDNVTLRTCGKKKYLFIQNSLSLSLSLWKSNYCLPNKNFILLLPHFLFFNMTTLGLQKRLLSVPSLPRDIFVYL